MAKCYILNKNLVSAWDYQSCVMCKNLLAVLIGKTIQSRMYLILENMIIAVDRLIDEDRSTEDTISFKLEATLYPYEYVPNIFKESTLKDYEIFRYVGKSQVQYINNIDRKDKYFGFVSPSSPSISIVPDLIVHIFSFHVTEKPINQLKAFEVLPDWTSFVPVNDLDLMNRYVLAYRIDGNSNMYFYTKDGSFKGANTMSTKWCNVSMTDNAILFPDPNKDSLENIRSFSSKEEATIAYFDYCTSDRLDKSFIRFGRRPFIGKMTKGKDGAIIIYDQKDRGY